MQTETKIEVYTAMLEKFRKDLLEFNTGRYQSVGFCGMFLRLEESFSNCYPKFYPNESIEESEYPELMAFKPEKLVNSEGVLRSAGVYWFDLYATGTQKRIEILELILNNLNNEQRTN